ncbi:MAG TPA: hypothetical protein VKB43_03575 [Gaiellaceae bacterium]|nr:hypothetical protein [Gaiellaceae bacterium]
MKPSMVAVLLAAVVLCLGVSVTAAFAGGTTLNGTTHCNPADPLCGLNPLLTGPAPPDQVTIIGTCPDFLTTDDWALNFTDGNSVSHGTQNKNGDWGGGTANGPAALTSSDGAVQYTGQATEWGGGGQNSNPGGPPTNQSEGGFTFHFNGSGPAGTISIHIHQHSTTNNAGTPTSNVFGATVTCS